MYFYDFNIKRYFDDNRHLVAYVNYSRKSLKISKKQMQKDNQIPHATYRRAELTDFVGHSEILQKLAEYFRVNTEIDKQIIENLNNDFNMFYTCVYFCELEKMEYYYKLIEDKKELYENSILISIYHFARLIFYVSSPRRKEINKIAETIEVLKMFRDDFLDIFAYLLDEYMYCYYSLIHNKELALKLSKKVYLDGQKFPRLLPLIYYQMSVNYYFINDYANSIYYSLEALPLLVNDLNYNRAILCHSNNSICFERLNNTVKSKEILAKIFMYLSSNDNPHLEFLAKLTLANCYVTDENYLEAIEIFKELEEKRNRKGENSLMILYCYYKSNNLKSFQDLASKLTIEMENDNFYKGYYDLVLLLEAMFSKNKREIVVRFANAQKSFPHYSDSKIVDLIYLEARNKKILPNSG